MIVECRTRGYQCVVMNARGCGDTVLRTARCFSAAATDDIRFTCRLVRSRLHVATPLFTVGFSLGAGIMAKFVAEDGVGLQGTVTAAGTVPVVVSVWCTHACQRLGSVRASWTTCGDCGGGGVYVLLRND